MFKISEKTIMLINIVANYNILASDKKFAINDFSYNLNIYISKDFSVFKNTIDEHFKNSNTLNYKQIQEYIKTLPDYKEIEIKDIKSGKNLDPGKYWIYIEKDPEEVLLQRKKCILNFVCKSCELEDNFKSPIEIKFDEIVNDNTSIVDYIKNTYKVKSFSDDDFSLIDKETGKNVLKYEKYYLLNKEYIIELNKHVDGITKKKEDDDLIFNISLKVNDKTNYKLKNDITTIPQFTLKKGSTSNDLAKYLKDNHGIETDWILSILDNKDSPLTIGDTHLKGGSYVLIFNNSENKFVEKNIKKPTNKNITLKIVPKDETNYKLKVISDNITINVPKNISYNDLVNEVKKTITDGKFEIYVDNNKVENGNIDINKPIIIKLLDDCDKLEKNVKKDKGEDNKGDDNNGNKQQTKQTKYCEGKCVKK